MPHYRKLRYRKTSGRTRQRHVQPVAEATLPAEPRIERNAPPAHDRPRGVPTSSLVESAANANALGPAERQLQRMPETQVPKHVIDYKGLHIMNDLQYYRCLEQVHPRALSRQAFDVLKCHRRKLAMPSPTLLDHNDRMVAPRSGLYQIQCDLALEAQAVIEAVIRVAVQCVTTQAPIWQADYAIHLDPSARLSVQTLVFLDEGTSWQLMLQSTHSGDRTIMCTAATLQFALLKAWNATTPNNVVRH